MKKILTISLLSLLLTSLENVNFKTYAQANNNIIHTVPSIDYANLQEGDIIFQNAPSHQSEGVQLATNSFYSHCGILYKEGNKFYVFEAVDPVSTRPLESWIAAGEKQHYVIKRLHNASEVITPSVLTKMRQVAATMEGKKYDWSFEWDDTRIYCSELVWKLYERGANIELCPVKTYAQLNLEHPKVQKLLKERHGDNIPLEEKIVSPQDLFASPLLITVQTQ